MSLGASSWSLAWEPEARPASGPELHCFDKGLTADAVGATDTTAWPASQFTLPGRLTRGYQGVSLEIPGSGPPFVKNPFFYRKINFFIVKFIGKKSRNFRIYNTRKNPKKWTFPKNIIEKLI